MIHRRHKPRRTPIAVAMLLVLASPARAELVFGSVGTEIDDRNGYILYGALGGDLGGRTTWDLAASSADTSTDFYDLRTTAYDGSVYHDFGAIGLRAGLGGWTDDEIVAVDQFSAAFDVHGDGWLIALQTRLGTSDFEPFDIDRTITRRDGSLLTISATADCKVDDTGMGARVRVSNDEWAFAVDGMTFDYDDFGCDFDLAALDVLRRATRDEFVQLADRVTDVLSFSSGRRLLYETSFLDSRLSLSLNRNTATRSYGLYYDRIEDVFFERTADTLSGSMSFVLASGNEIEAYLGATDTDGEDTVFFVGLSLLMLR